MEAQPKCVPGNLQGALIAVAAATLTLASTCVGLRLFVRARLLRALGQDDCCITFALLLSAAAIGLGGKQIQNGLGIHAGCLTEEMVVQEDKYQSIFQIPLVLSTLFSRVSVCALLLRLFSHLKSWRYTLYFIAGLTTAVNTAFATFLLLQCKPRARLWDKTIPGHCWALKTVYSVDIFQIAVSIILDLCLSIMPVLILRRIRLSLRNKIGICFLMGLGLFATASILARAFLLKKLRGEDLTYTAAEPGLFGLLEMNLAIIAASMPALRPLFVRNTYIRQNGASNMYRRNTVLRFFQDTYHRLSSSLQSSRRGRERETPGRSTERTTPQSTHLEPPKEAVPRDMVGAGRRPTLDVRITRGSMLINSDMMV